MENRKVTNLSSEEHTLFIKQIPEQKKVVNRSKHIYKIIPKHRKFTVYIGKFKEFKRGLHLVLNELRTATNHDVLELRINSTGGFVNEGKQFYNLIEEKFHKRTVAYIDNQAYSMGALMFCMAKKRVIYPYSDIMFHNYSTSVLGKGSEVKSRLEHKDRLLISFFRSIIVDKGFLTENEFKNMLIGQDYWMDSIQMCERGIATHIIIEGKELKAKKFLKLYPSLKSGKKKWNKK